VKLFNIRYFPFKSIKSKKGRSLLLGIGGNIGDVSMRFQRLFAILRRDFHLQKTSPILENPPFGYLEQDDFLNAVILLRSDSKPYTILKRMKYLERRFGRKKRFRNAPRELDIDIIFYENLKIRNYDLQIPHKYWKERDSVVIPLQYLGRRYGYRESNR
jgi:2-amino-4-hydroxy-6-hydroxymethyldihydropteridine diphosphokinase